MSEFKPIPLFPNYLINREGDVKSLHLNRVLRKFSGGMVTISNEIERRNIRCSCMAHWVFVELPKIERREEMKILYKGNRLLMFLKGIEDSLKNILNKYRK